MAVALVCLLIPLAAAGRGAPDPVIQVVQDETWFVTQDNGAAGPYLYYFYLDGFLSGLPDDQLKQRDAIHRSIMHDETLRYAYETAAFLVGGFLKSACGNFMTTLTAKTYGYLGFRLMNEQARAPDSFSKRLGDLPDVAHDAIARVLREPGGCSGEDAVRLMYGVNNFLDNLATEMR